MRIKNVKYKFKKGIIDINFNSPSESDSNTYSLLLGNNGAGKSSLFENILNYYSKEKQDDYKNTASIIDEGIPKKIILSTYSPYDRIRNLKSKKMNRFTIRKNEDYDIEIINPKHTFDNIVGMACNAYYKCKIKNNDYFSRVESQISNLLQIKEESIFLLIENHNQTSIDKLFRLSQIPESKVLYDLLNKRLECFNDPLKIKIESFSSLITQKKNLFNNLIQEFRGLTKNDLKLRIEIESIYHRAFNSENYIHELDIENEKIIERFSERIVNRDRLEATISELVEKRLEISNAIENLANEPLVKDNIDKQLFLKFYRAEHFKLFMVLVYLKKLYQRIKSVYGKEHIYYGNNKQFLSISSIKEFYRLHESTAAIETIYNSDGFQYLMNIDFDILEHTENFLIDDLLIYKEDDYIPISSFSSGELSVFLRIMEISLYVEEHSLILIDEPEIHLNPEWIIKYYYILKKCFRNMNSHFIIASQSPLIVNLFHKSQVFYITSSNGQSIIKHFYEETFVNSIDNILKFVFGINYSDNPIFNEEFQRIKEKSSENLLSALDSIDEIADGRFRNKISSEILSKENIEKYIALIGEDASYHKELISEELQKDDE